MVTTADGTVQPACGYRYGLISAWRRKHGKIADGPACTMPAPVECSGTPGVVTTTCDK
jgi:hypothetical protein